MAILLEVRTACPSVETAMAMADVLITEKLAACIQLVPGLTSVFHWEGGLRHECEVLALLKTTTEAWPALHKRIRELHPYAVPEVLALPVQHADAEYASWVSAACSSDPR